MFRKLVENVGKKIKICAIVVFILMVISAIVSSIIVGADGHFEDEALLYFFGILIVGIAVAFFVSYFLYGFGIIVEAQEKFLAQPTLPEQNNNAPVATGTWVCSCGNVMGAAQNFCTTCGKKR